MYQRNLQLQLGPVHPGWQRHFFPLQIPCPEQRFGQLRTSMISCGGFVPDFSLHLLLCLQIEASHWISIRGKEKTAQLGSSIKVTSEILLLFVLFYWNSYNIIYGSQIFKGILYSLMFSGQFLKVMNNKSQIWRSRPIRQNDMHPPEQKKIFSLSLYLDNWRAESTAE